MTKNDLVSGLEQRSKELLKQLEGFKNIEIDYRQTVKALKAITGQRLIGGGNLLMPGRKSHKKKVSAA